MRNDRAKNDNRFCLECGFRWYSALPATSFVDDECAKMIRMERASWSFWSEVGMQPTHALQRLSTIGAVAWIWPCGGKLHAASGNEWNAHWFAAMRSGGHFGFYTLAPSDWKGIELVMNAFHEWNDHILIGQDDTGLKCPLCAATIFRTEWRHYSAL